MRSALQPVPAHFRVGVFERALHPSGFAIRGRSRLDRAGWGLEVWLLRGGHLLRFESGRAALSEVVAGVRAPMPRAGAVFYFNASAEHEAEHRLGGGGAYLVSAQAETLPAHLYLSILEELAAAGPAQGLLCRWNGRAGPCLSMVEVEAFADQVHANGYHLLARHGLILRTQTIFERGGAPGDQPRRSSAPSPGGAGR